MKVLVVGGAGYIGSHTVFELIKSGFTVGVYDSLETSTKKNLDKVAELTNTEIDFTEGNILDKEKFEQAVTDFEPEAVIHFAAYKNAGESVEKPDKYYKNNVVGALNVLNVLKNHNINKFIFSSSSAVYGDQPSQLPYTEKTLPNPISAYGKTKLTVEYILQDYNVAYGINSVALRYFNAAGADKSGLIGEEVKSTGNVIPLIMENLLGRRKEFYLFGDKFATKDGTQERDYIHVTDLARGHIKALEKITKQNGHFAYNLATGVASSNKTLIDLSEKVSGKKLQVNVVEPRPGDPLIVYADPSFAEHELDWKAENSIEDIIESAWNWHKSQ